LDTDSYHHTYSLLCTLLDIQGINQGLVAQVSVLAVAVVPGVGGVEALPPLKNGGLGLFLFLPTFESRALR